MESSNQLRRLFAAGYQLSPEAFSLLNSIGNSDQIIEQILALKPDKLILSLEDVNQIIKQIMGEEDIEELPAEQDTRKEETIVEDSSSDIKTEKKKVEKKKIEKKKVEKIPETHIRDEQILADLKVISSPIIKKSKLSVTDFRRYFESRYDLISDFFTKRRDITNKVNTEYLKSLKTKETVSLIGIVTSKQKTRKGNIILELEDKNGSVTGLIMSSNTDLIHTAEFILEDSVLCFVGNWSKDLLGITDVFWPDIPYNHKPNHSYEEVLALFISDIHIGSGNFAGELFLRLINFVNGNLESEKYNEVGKKIKYLFVGGDVVDGVGVYPGQIDDLLLDNIYLQYLLAAEYFEQIRSDVEIVIIPGNHDGARAAEPQTPIQKEFAPELYKLDNVHLLGSPSYLKAHNVEILMSHGNSIMDINSAIPAIPHETSMPAMVEMLKNRHLVPIYGKRTSIVPDSVDQLVITKIPDIFQTGHTHIAGDEIYKGVTLINSGTFQYQTIYQKNMNINPTTGVTYIINLKNLQRTMIDFNTIS
ncbi:MAG: metallophosphoesterase [Candidatus Heimdallarchaeaceae archaeon]|jgi:DNA polymerase II small subunit